MNKKNKVILGVLILTIIIVTSLIIIFLKKEEEPFLVENTFLANEVLEKDNKIIKELEENKYSLDNALVVNDPYNASPLTSLMAFYTETKEKVKVTLVGKNNDDLTYEYDEANYHYIPVYGLYNNYENKVIVELSNGVKKEITISTPDLFGENASLFTESKVIDETKLDKTAFYFVTCPFIMNTLGIDAYGEIRWISSNNYFHDIKILDNGHFMIAGTYDDISGNGANVIREIDYLGRIYKEYKIVEGFTNDFTIIDNGNILVASTSDRENSASSEVILEIDGKTGKVVKETNIFKLFNDIDPSVAGKFHYYNSGIKYYSKTNELLLTYWQGEFVLNLNYKTGEINWIFSNPENFSSAFNNYLLKSDNYPKSMHSAELNGDVLSVFDNGYSTNGTIVNMKELKGSYSSANKYKINGNKIELINSYDYNKSFFSYALGDYNIDGENETILFGRELIGFNNMDIDMDISEYPEIVSVIIDMKDSKEVNGLIITTPTQNVTKFDMTKSANFNFDGTKTYSSIKPTSIKPLTSDIIKELKNVTDETEITFGYENRTIESNYIYTEGDTMELILIDSNNKGGIYTFKDSNTTTYKVYSDLNKGKYTMYIKLNGVIYKTNKYLEIE